MTDQILINDLFLRTIIGVNDDERSNRQDVLINLALDVDTRPAARSDNIDDAVNYRTIAKQVIEAAMAHRLKDKAEAAYARGDLFSKRRDLMEAWAKFSS